MEAVDGRAGTAPLCAGSTEADAAAAGEGLPPALALRTTEAAEEVEGEGEGEAGLGAAPFGSGSGSGETGAVGVAGASGELGGKRDASDAVFFIQPARTRGDWLSCSTANQHTQTLSSCLYHHTNAPASHEAHSSTHTHRSKQLQNVFFCLLFGEHRNRGRGRAGAIGFERSRRRRRATNHASGAVRRSGRGARASHRGNCNPPPHSTAQVTFAARNNPSSLVRQVQRKGRGSGVKYVGKTAVGTALNAWAVVWLSRPLWAKLWSRLERGHHWSEQRDLLLRTSRSLRQTQRSQRPRHHFQRHLSPRRSAEQDRAHRRPPQSLSQHHRPFESANPKSQPKQLQIVT
jgi:hypothetical protein